MHPFNLAYPSTPLPVFTLQHYLYIICDHNNSFSIIFRLSFSALCSQAEYMVSMITLIPLIMVISCSSHFRVEHYLAFSTYYSLAI